VSASRPLPGGLGLRSKAKERAVTGGLGQSVINENIVLIWLWFVE